jgi:hypothetical protein
VSSDPGAPVFHLRSHAWATKVKYRFRPLRFLFTFDITHPHPARQLSMTKSSAHSADHDLHNFLPSLRSQQCYFCPPWQPRRALSQSQSTDWKPTSLRPHVNTTSFINSISWTHTIQELHLDHDAILAHTARLGNDYSIIDAVGHLSPEELRRIQEHAKAKNGRLVSIQYGKPAELVTQMSTIQVKSVVFVIKITEKLEHEVLTAKTAAPVANPVIHQSALPPYSNQSAAVHLTAGDEESMFQIMPGAPVVISNPVILPDSAKTVPPLIVLPTPSTANVHPPASRSVARPSYDFIRSNTDAHFFEERDKDISATARRGYVSLSFAAPFKKQSFEETRLADYNARYAAPKAGAPPFGGQYACPATGHYTLPFSSITGEGLFGQQVANSTDIPSLPIGRKRPMDGYIGFERYPTAPKPLHSSVVGLGDGSTTSGFREGQEKGKDTVTDGDGE